MMGKPLYKKRSFCLRLLSIHEICPVVRIANYIKVTPEMTWLNRRIPDLELILVASGEYEYIAESQRHLLGEGDVLFIEPGILHSKRMLAGCPHGVLSAIHLELQPDASWLAGDYRLTPHPETVTRVENFDYLRGRFRRLAEVYQGYSPYREELTSAIAREILALLACSWQPGERNQVTPRVQAMIDYIRANLTTPISRLDLARAFHVSPAYVNSLFQRELGITPTAMIHRERVVAAYNLMFEQGLSVKEAAQVVGFQDQFYFSRVFKRIMGYAPSAVASNNTMARLFPID
jgi:AraC-like DNA-binding protein